MRHKASGSLESETNPMPEAGDWIFFYGSLMRGLGALNEIPSNHALRYIGPARIRGELFDLGPYPGLRATQEARSVLGELHAILVPRVVEELDAFEGYTPEAPDDSLYIRREVRLVSATGDPQAKAPNEARIWAYFYNHAPDPSTRVDSGDWRAHISSQNKEGLPE